MSKQRFRPQDVAMNREGDIFVVVSSTMVPHSAGTRVYAFKDKTCRHRRGWVPLPSGSPTPARPAVVRRADLGRRTERAAKRVRDMGGVIADTGLWSRRFGGAFRFGCVGRDSSFRRGGRPR